MSAKYLRFDPKVMSSKFFPRIKAFVSSSHFNDSSFIVATPGEALVHRRRTTHAEDAMENLMHQQGDGEPKQIHELIMNACMFKHIFVSTVINGCRCIVLSFSGIHLDNPPRIAIQTCTLSYEQQEANPH